MKRGTSVLLGALLWAAVLAVMAAGVLFNRNGAGDVLHATHAVRAPSPPSPARSTGEAPVAAPCATTQKPPPIVEKEC